MKVAGSRGNIAKYTLHFPSNTLLFNLALSELCVEQLSEPPNVIFEAVLFKNSSKITSCTLTKRTNKMTQRHLIVKVEKVEHTLQMTS